MKKEKTPFVPCLVRHHLIMLISQRKYQKLKDIVDTVVSRYIKRIMFFVIIFVHQKISQRKEILKK